MEFGISCSPAQMRKLKSGGAITLAPRNFVDGSPHRIMVMPNTARRIHTAMRKNKGVRIALKPEEDLVAMTEGGKISLKSIGRSLSKAFDPKKNGVANVVNDAGKALTKTGDVIKRGFNKEIVDSGVGKAIAKNLIDVGTDVVLPTALGGLSMLAGDPTGMSGQAVGQIAGKYINRAAEKGGYGTKKGMRRKTARLAYEQVGGSTYAQRLARRTRNTFKDIGKAVKKVASNPIVKEIGKQALREGAKAAGEALTAYTGNPAAGLALERVAVAGGDKLIDSEGNVKKAGKAALKQTKRIAVEAVDDYIDQNLTGVEREIAQNALAGKYPSASDLVYDYGNSKIEEMVPPAFAGYGLPRRTRGGLRMGRGLAHLTPAYAVAMRSATSGAGFRVADDRMITPATAPSSIIQTGSPYQRINSAAMSPFIPSSPQLAGFKEGGMVRCGGSFYPAGRGGSFVPAG